MSDKGFIKFKQLTKLRNRLKHFFVKLLPKKILRPSLKLISRITVSIAELSRLMIFILLPIFAFLFLSPGNKTKPRLISINL